MLNLIGFIIVCIVLVCLLGLCFYGIGYAIGMGMMACFEDFEGEIEIKMTAKKEETPTEEESNG